MMEDSNNCKNNLSIYTMEMNSLEANGVPPVSEGLTKEQLQDYRMTSHYYMSPTVLLRLTDPRAYFTGLIWELEELLKQRHDNLKSGYRYDSENNSGIETEVDQLSGKECSEETHVCNEFKLDLMKQMFLQRQQGSRIVSDRKLHMRNTIEPISSPVPDLQEKHTSQSFINPVGTSTTGVVVNCNEVQKHEGKQYIVVENGIYPECGKEASKEISRSQNEYTDGFARNKFVKIEQSQSNEQQNINYILDEGKIIPWMFHNKDISVTATTSNFSDDSINPDVSYLIQDISQAPVLHHNAPANVLAYEILEHST